LGIIQTSNTTEELYAIADHPPRWRKLCQIKQISEVSLKDFSA